MSKDEAAHEAEIKRKGLNAPRLTPEHIDAQIVGEEYGVFAGRMTICVLTLRNGFLISGESSSVSKENFDEDLGRKIARENARNKIWQLEGYLLRDFVHQTSPSRIGRLGQLLRDAEMINGGSMPHEALVHTVLDDARRYPA